MLVQKILWPVDFSANSSDAKSHVQSLAQKYEAEIHILHVIDDLSHPDEPWYGDIEESHAKALRERAKKEAENRLNQICENHLDNCPLFFRHVLVGNPAKSIVDFAKNNEIDLIILSSCGKSAHFDFGSVADKVIKNGLVPTVCVPVKNTGTPTG